MRLPESVIDNTEAASSAPYGSLNESQFRLPSSASSRIRGAEDNGNANGNANVAQSYNSSSNTLDIQMRVQQMRKNGTLMKNEKGGLASLFGGGGGGIAQKNDAEEYQVGLNDLSNTIQDITLATVTSTTEEDDDQQLYGQEKNSQQMGDKALGGIGSLIDKSSLEQQMQQISTNTVTGTALSTAQSSLSGTGRQSSLDEGQLSGSLTGLSILRDAPRGLVDLGPAEREAIAGIRSKSVSISEDGSRFLLNDNANISSPSRPEAKPAGGRGFSFLGGQARKNSMESENSQEDIADDASEDELFNMDM